MFTAPLFVKCRAKSGLFYVYDPGTGEIVRIAEVAYQILDDWHVLRHDELIKKHALLGEQRVMQSLAWLEMLQARGLFCDCGPRRSVKSDHVLYAGHKEPLKDFLQRHRRVLILEITQKCNLRCEYCCYGEHYPQFREHGEETMSIATAESAVEDFITGHRLKKYYIAFYGGEPLLEFALLKEIVLFSENLASQFEADVRFNLTTNGTLLNDEKIHFLVVHRFRVRVSFDGVEEAHDRYRVVRDEQHPERLVGSYQLVKKNMDRFVELYPSYANRAIAVTVTATSRFDEINKSLRNIVPTFPLNEPSYVRQPNALFGSEEDEGLSVAPWPTRCANGRCDAESCVLDRGIEGSKCAGDVPASGGASEEPGGLVEFWNWTPERRQLLQLSWAQPVLHSPSKLCVFMQRLARVASSGCHDTGRDVVFLSQSGIR